MKKLILLGAVVLLSTAVALAQTKTKTEKTTVVKDEKTTKKTSTLPQKVHNTFSKKKHYSGKKTTHVKEVKKEKETK